MDPLGENKFQIAQKQHELYKEDMLQDKEFADVTLASNDDKHIDAHRIILSSQSSFFNRILKLNSKRDVLIFLPNLSYVQLQSILEYIYLGNTEVEEQNLENFLEVGKQLGIGGFEEAMNPDVSTMDMVNIKEFGYAGKKFCINKPKLERQSNGKFSCDQCEYQSVTRNGIKRHRDGVHLGLKYKCSECSIEYSTEKQVKAHITSVHNGEFYNCHICDKKFEQPAVLSQHVKRLHEGVRNYSKCKECDKTFKHGAGLSYHIQKEHRDETHPCDQCNYEAKVSKNLSLHKKRKH